MNCQFFENHSDFKNKLQVFDTSHAHSYTSAPVM